MIHHSTLPHHSIVCSVSSSMWLSLIVRCVFSIGNRPRILANYCSCFSIPDGSILELLGFSSKSTVLQHPSGQLHHSSVLFCTICQHSSSPFVSAVLHHSSAQFCTIRQFSSAPFVSYHSAPFVNAILQFCIIKQSC